MSDIADNLKSVLPGGIEIPDSLVEGEPAAVAGSTVGRWMKDVIDDLGLPAMHADAGRHRIIRRSR